MLGRILVVDDVATNRIVLKVKLCSARYDVVCASDGEEALSVARGGAVDAIIMDMMMPGRSGVEICRALRADPATAAIPIVMVTASDDPAARLAGLEAGADEFLTRPVDEVALLARMRSLLRVREEERDIEAQGGWLGDEVQPDRAGSATGATSGRIAILGDDPAMSEAMATLLAPAFRDRPVAMDADAALSSASDAVDLFLIDADLGGPNEGMRLMSDLRSRLATRRASCIVLMPPGDADRAATALDLGAVDVVHRPILSRELTVRIRTHLARKQRADRMRDSVEQGLRLAVVDPLTGLYNRRYGMHHLERVAARSRDRGRPAGVVMIDLDHFKAVNDEHGHPVGDRVLSEVAQVLRANLRVEDLVCRLGGEEFMAVLPDTPIDKVHAVADRLRRAVADLSVPLNGGSFLGVTVSVGITALEPGSEACARALDRADRALYEAKAEGRDRVVLAGASTGT